MRVSLFRHARDNDPIMRTYADWEAFTKDIGPHEVRQSKTLCPAVSPAIYEPGETRANDNVIGFSYGPLDLDKLTLEQANHTIELAQPYGYVAYSTYSYFKRLPLLSFRIFFRLSREVHPEEWSDFWEALVMLMGGYGDPQCKDESRLYFGPFCPPEDDPSKHFVTVNEGPPIDVDKLLGNPPPLPGPGEPQSPTTVLSRAAFEAFSKKLAKSSTPYLADQGSRLVMVCNGESFATQGERDVMLFKLCNRIVDAFPDYDPAPIGELFRPSLDLMASLHPRDHLTVDDVIAKLSTIQAARQRQATQRKRSDDERKRTRIRLAFGTDRVQLYQPDELPPEDFYYVQRGKDYYVWADGSYRGPYVKDEFYAQSLVLLSPAPVQLLNISKTGNITFKPIPDLMREHGVAAHKAIVDLTADETTFRTKSRTIVEAPCPLRTDLTPRFSRDVDIWLRKLGGLLQHELLSWIAYVTKLSRPSVALLLTGAPDAGKSFLALTMARLWGFKQPTPLDKAMGQFNSMIADCPLILADEYLPTDMRGELRLKELRNFIQAVVRPYSRKFQSEADMVGAIRLIITANNIDLVSTREALGINDIKALSERFLSVHVTPDAAEWLATCNTHKWLDEDTVARHALWLRDNHKWVPVGRFGIRSSSNAFALGLATKAGLASSLCRWLCSFLVDPNKLGLRNNTLWVRVKGGKLLLHVKGLLDMWDAYLPGPSPAVSTLRRAIAAISIGRTRIKDGFDQLQNYRIVDVAALKAWASDHDDYIGEEDIDAALKRETEVKTALKAVANITKRKPA